jgi:phytol kinase
MLTAQTFSDILWVFILVFYVFLVTFATKKFYAIMMSRGLSEDETHYFNRKLVHILAGGVVVLVVPLVFSSPVYPLICGLAMTLFTFLSHSRGKLLYWFQTKDNRYDVNFCLMWGITIFVLWVLLGSPWIAIIPAAFMSFGDGITGIIRNIVIKKREKHFIGNLYMAGISIPLGYGLAGLGGIAPAGALAGLAASIVERFEFGVIDDNILVAVSSSVLLYAYDVLYHFAIG